MGTNKTNPAGNIAHGVNDHRLSDLLAKAGTFGEAAGTGDSSIIALAWATFDSAVDGAISTIKPKAGEDDAAQIYSAFAAGRNLTGCDIENPDSRKAQVSKLRSVVAAGSRPVVRKIAAKWRADFEQAWADAGKPGVYGALVKIAGAEKKLPDAETMSYSDMLAALTKSPDPKSQRDRLEAQRKAVAKLNVEIESPHVEAALAEIDKAIAELLAMEIAAEEAQEKQAALGKMSKAELEAYLATLDTDIEAAA